jgi:hypothetical protein
VTTHPQNAKASDRSCTICLPVFVYRSSRNYRICHALPEKFVFVLLRQASTKAMLRKRQDAFGYRGAEATSRATLPSICMKFLAENLAIENHSNHPAKNQHKRVLVVTGDLYL